MGDGEDFEGTLDRLQEARAAAEDVYFDRLKRLEGRVARLRESASAAAEAAGHPPDPGAEILPPAAAPTLPSVTDPATVHEPWPSGGGWLRRRLNAVLRWALRDYLSALDHRHDSIVTAFADQAQSTRDLRDALQPVLVQLQRADTTLERGLAARQQEVSEHLRATLEAVRETVNRTVEGLDLMSGAAEKLRLVGDAKDAETLQRAAHGPLRKMEIMFDEFGRQQEALLAELVGRRQELERLAAQARGVTEE